MILTPKSKVLEQPNRQTSLSHEHRRSPNPKTLITKPPNPVRKSPQTKNPENPKPQTLKQTCLAASRLSGVFFSDLLVFSTVARRTNLRKSEPTMILYNYIVGVQAAVQLKHPSWAQPGMEKMCDQKWQATSGWDLGTCWVQWQSVNPRQETTGASMQCSWIQEITAHSDLQYWTRLRIKTTPSGQACMLRGLSSGLTASFPPLSAVKKQLIPFLKTRLTASFPFCLQ